MPLSKQQETFEGNYLDCYTVCFFIRIRTADIQIIPDPKTELDL